MDWKHQLYSKGRVLAVSGECLSYDRFHISAAAMTVSLMADEAGSSYFWGAIRLIDSD